MTQTSTNGTPVSYPVGWKGFIGTVKVKIVQLNISFCTGLKKAVVIPAKSFAQS